MKKLCLSYNSLIILIFVVLFQPEQTTFMALRPSDLVLLLIYFYQILTGVPRLKITKFKFLKNFGIYFAFIITISLISLVLYTDHNVSADRLYWIYHFLRFYLLFIIVSKIVMCDDRFGSILIKGYLFMILLVILSSFFQYFHIEPFSQIINELYVSSEPLNLYYLTDNIRVVGVIGNTNALAIIMASIAPIFLIPLFQKTQHNYIVLTIYLVSFLLLFFSVAFLTSSRTSIISILFCLFFVLFNNIKSHSAIKTISLLTIFTSILFLIINTSFIEILVPERILLFFESPFQDKNDAGNWFNRSYFWEEKIRIFNHINYPLKSIFGLSNVYKDIITADNGILTTFFNYGFMGAALRTLLYFYIIILLYKSTKLHKHHNNAQTNQVYLSVLIVFLLLIFDFSSEVLEYYKISQVFYIFLTISVVKYNILISQKNNETNSISL